jgi:hypothetical protein
MTFAATDWVMSVQESWSSTMFPVIFAVNAFLCAWAFNIIVVLQLNRKVTAGSVTFQDQLNLGSFLLAFTMFWSYTSFSQFMLIWVGNLPEEIPFFLRRTRGGWEWVSIALGIFHFAVPFVLLLYRDIKSSRVRLTGMAIFLLVMAFIDVWWWIEPRFISLDEQPLSWLADVGAVAAIGGVWTWMFLGELKKRSLLPVLELETLNHDH